MKEKLYNEQGQVEDQKIAEEMAYAEKPYRERKRMHGLMGPSSSKVHEGGAKAEQIGSDLINEKIEKQLLAEAAELNMRLSKKNWGFSINGKVKGYEIEVTGVGVPYDFPGATHEIQQFRDMKGIIDGEPMSSNQAENIARKYFNILRKKYYQNESKEEERNEANVNDKIKKIIE